MIYLFKHALVQDAALRHAVARAASCIACAHCRGAGRQFADIVDRRPEVLARHCTEAGFRSKRRFGYFLKAGQRAVVRSAMTEAMAQLRKGLDRAAQAPR